MGVARKFHIKIGVAKKKYLKSTDLDQHSGLSTKCAPIADDGDSLEAARVPLIPWSLRGMCCLTRSIKRLDVRPTYRLPQWHKSRKRHYLYEGWAERLSYSCIKVTDVSLDKFSLSVFLKFLVKYKYY